MKKLETVLDDFFVKRAPFQIPENGRQGLVRVLPWLALIGGIFMLWGASILWQLMSWADRWTGVANELGAMYGTGYVTHATASPLLWVSLVLMVVGAILFFAAFPSLRAYKKSGWDILFWVAIVNILQSIVQAIAYIDVGGLLVTLIVTSISLYLLFQIRPYYTGEKALPAVSAPATPPPAADSKSKASADTVEPPTLITPTEEKPKKKA